MSEIENTVSFFKSVDGDREIFFQKFRSPNHGETKASIVVTHGLGEHSEPYRELCEELALKYPVDVYVWDLPGHGKSSGQRGYVGHISWLTKDYALFLRLLSEKAPSKPLHLISHSLGGLLALSLETSGVFDKLKVQSLILSNPCVALNFTPPKWKTSGAQILTKFAPRLTLGSEIYPHQLSSDPDYLEKHKSDPLKHQRISPRLFLGMLELMDKLKKPQNTDLKTLVLLSSHDPICCPHSSQKLLEDRARLVFFEKSMHEVLNDVEKELAVAQIKDFLNEQF